MIKTKQANEAECDVVGWLNWTMTNNTNINIDQYQYPQYL